MSLAREGTQVLLDRESNPRAPRIVHYMIGDGKPRGGPTRTITHYGIAAEDGTTPEGLSIPRGTILSVKKEVSEAEAREYLEGGKALVHKALGHRRSAPWRSLRKCRDGVCGKIQQEIDQL
jgi:hypothetical protein